MAQRGRSSKRTCCCLVPTIIILLIIVALIVSVVVVLNSTPNKLGFGDLEIADGYSLNSLGLGDVKIKDMVSYISDMFQEPDESEIVTNPITQEDKEATDEIVSAANDVPVTDDGTPNYASIIAAKEPLMYNEQYLETYEDTYIAYVVNQAITQNVDDMVKDDSFQALDSLDASVVEVDILKNDDGSYYMKTICSVNLAEVRSSIESELSELGSVSDMLIDMIPSKVYIIVENNISADENGKLTYTAKSVSINNMQNEALTKSILKAVSSAVDSKNENDEDALNKTVGKALSKAIGQLGDIGTAETDEDGVVQGNVKLGASGIDTGKLYLIVNKVVEK